VYHIFFKKKSYEPQTFEQYSVNYKLITPKLRWLHFYNKYAGIIITDDNYEAAVLYAKYF